jgi:hypothetical protein
MSYEQHNRSMQVERSSRHSVRWHHRSRLDRGRLMFRAGQAARAVASRQAALDCSRRQHRADRPGRSRRATADSSDHREGHRCGAGRARSLPPPNRPWSKPRRLARSSLLRSGRPLTSG